MNAKGFIGWQALDQVPEVLEAKCVTEVLIFYLKSEVETRYQMIQKDFVLVIRLEHSETMVEQENSLLNKRIFHGEQLVACL